MKIETGLMRWSYMSLKDGRVGLRCEEKRGCKKVIVVGFGGGLKTIFTYFVGQRERKNQLYWCMWQTPNMLLHGIDSAACS